MTAGGEFDVELRDAIDDIKWVLSELATTFLVANGSMSAKKRACEADSDSEPSTKKCVHHSYSSITTHNELFGRARVTV